MRKYLCLAVAAASVSVLAAPVVASAAPTAKPHVLTVGKAGGNAVKVGAKLTASLVKGTKAIFAMSGQTLTCSSASFKAVVVKNPTKPGKALESLTAQTVAKCKTSLSGVKIKKTFASNLPYNTSVSDAKGDPVAVTPRSAKKPIELTAVASLGTTTISCPYTAKIVKGAASNKGNTLTITKQKFTVVKGSNALCPASSNFTATFGPVKDTSVKGNQTVFVN
ncbi:MAG TPA: hypothetical protein VGM14_03870 [Streptosporangiaceae bacterium]